MNVAIYACVGAMLVFGIFSVLSRHLINAAIDGIKKRFSQIGTGSEELHLFADAHGRNAAGDTVIISPIGTHQVVIFILDGTAFNGRSGAEFLKWSRQVLRP